MRSRVRAWRWKWRGGWETKDVVRVLAAAVAERAAAPMFIRIDSGPAP